MKLVKIRFTAWGDKHRTPRSAALQRRLNDWALREDVLQRAAARVQEQRSKADSEALGLEFAAITTELVNINAHRQPIIDDETAAAHQTQRAMFRHPMVGTFGYQIWNDIGTEVITVVDDAGNDLPAEVMFSYDVVDDDSPLPEWAMHGRFRHFE
ncbi:MAG TPA: hypothetical protein VJT81_20065 [Burkholderiales bacterium]|nr:hypothetical protein [Burkholderiales bacterium]